MDRCRQCWADSANAGPCDNCKAELEPRTKIVHVHHYNNEPTSNVHVPFKSADWLFMGFCWGIPGIIIIIGIIKAIIEG